ncbi:MAG TPA: hypothetical protein VHW23_15285 [Kofleriaceae bacterium]|jgi:hypothetical protein|nr:hypothetical protein [Kofleriaceae bacterium]
MTNSTMTSARLGAAWTCVLGAALAACSDPPSEPVSPDPKPGSAPIVARTRPATAAECSSGGTVVLSGPDANRDGMLQDAEVLTRSVVCNPPSAPPPPPIVIRLVAEPPGTNCEAGGTAVESGPDHNGNGQLDDGEVAHIDYACGEVLRTRIDAVAPGAGCAAGGVAFAFGRDRDGNGVLDDGEIEARELQCGDAVARDIDIETDADVAALAKVRFVTGSVHVNGMRVHALSLPNLEHVGGELQAFGFALSGVALPALRAVDGKASLGGSAISCPQLRRVGGLELGISQVQDLSGLPALTEIDGDVRIESSSLVSLELASVSIRGDVDITGNDRLARVALELAGRVGAVSLLGNGALETLDLSVTSPQPGGAEVGDVNLGVDGKLAHVALTADRVGSLDALGTPAIRDLALNVARFDGEIGLFDIATPFGLTLSSPSAEGVEIARDLLISGPLTSFQVTGPVTVGGAFQLEGTQLEALDLTQPLRVGDGLGLFDNAQLARVAPITLTGGLEVIHNARLQSLDFVVPATAGEIDELMVMDNPVLEAAPSLAPLVAVHGLVEIEDNPLLAGVFGPSLATVDGPMVIVRNDALAELQLPGLHGRLLDLIVQGNAALQHLELPAVVDVAAELQIVSNPQLLHIGFDALTHAALFEVDNNPRLPACQVTAVFVHVVSEGVTQSGNDDAATCP